ncbi:MAG: hypothetical protein JKX92_03160 [Porticoccaceae bacterium]|nr:hypothetical protein [Porticoccaceae bacterium]
MKYITFVVLVILITGCSKPNKFESEFEKPEWFNSIDAPALSTVNEVSALWQSEKRCCEDENTLLKNNRVFYKGCFNGIVDHYENEGLVVKCLWLMDIGAEPDQRVQITRFLIKNFSHHKNSIARCSNCMSGDTIARETLTLARYEKRLSNSKDKSIRLLENVLDNRLDEISYWVQAELYEYLGELYLESQLNDERLERMREVFDRFNKVKKYNEPLERRYKSFEKVYQVIIEESHNQSKHRG